MFKVRKRCGYSFVIALFAMSLLISGCGPESHAPRIYCSNFGVENVRRNLKLRVSVKVDRPPLSGVDTSTVKLLVLPTLTPVPGDVYYTGDRIIFVPESPLQDSTHYRFEVKGDIKDAGGVKITPMYQEFWTGSILQVFYVDLLYDYDSYAGRVYSIAVYFSEGVNPLDLYNSYGSLSLTDTNDIPLNFDVRYYDRVALAVLNFSTFPLTVGSKYTLSVGPYIYSSSDGGQLDGDRDGIIYDNEPFTISFRYQSDMLYGITVVDTVTNALPYYEPIERCYLYEFE